ncbi:integral membrane protein [Aspergillus bombycis]|uniref:Integral membrane protein n=1 Tax=Aspergillus bombycis TaxID=109264 RepID=A0A1F8AHQ0_9EURO|nr:integral membrane protein [Aspergillus bombycis]OGM51264.1 integral membrane protein [Aspergillus bombycis]
MADQKDAFQALSSENRGTIITLTSVSLLIVAIIFVAAKFGSAIYFKQRRTAVNTPIWAALICAIIQVVLLQKAVDHGLGKHQDRLSDGDIQAWSKFAYAAHLLLIVAMSLSKMSTILLIWKLTPSKSLHRSCAVTAGVVVGWSIFAVLGIAFQCAMPGPWLYSPERCAGEGTIFYPIAVFNILTEVIIVILPFIMMHNVQMIWHKRVKILSSFSSRLSIVALGIVHLALLPSFSHSTDISWDIVNWEITAQAMMLTAVIIACVPTLYHIFAGLHSGLTTTQIPDRIGLELPQTKASGYINQSSSGVSQSHSRSRSRGRSRKNGRSMFDGRDTDVVVITEVSTGADQGDRQSSSSEGAESTRNLTQDSQRKGGVLRTVDVTVSVEKQDHWVRH